jgi:hypothetical protein
MRGKSSRQNKVGRSRSAKNSELGIRVAPRLVGRVAAADRRAVPWAIPMADRRSLDEELFG